MNKFFYRGNYVFLIALLYCMTINNTSLAQNTNVQLLGRIVDTKTKQSLQGATIHIKGTTHEVLANKNGEFEFITGQRVPVTYVISYVGYETKEVLVSSYGHIDIELSEANGQLDDVVLVGYATQKRKSLVGSIAKIKAQETKYIPVASFDAQLQGKAADIQVNTFSGTPGESVKYRYVVLLL